MWYGLVVNGELMCVKRFDREPLIWDFHTGYFSQWTYEVVEVSVAITGTVAPSC